MADRSIPRLGKAFVAFLCVASSAAWLTGASTVSRPTGSASSAHRMRFISGVGAPTLRALQLNLCDSGIAPCYTGRSVAAAAAVLRDRRPDIVTLNEVCRADVSALKRPLSAGHPDRVVVSAFQPAGDRRSDGAFRCLNGQQYGIGIVALLPSSVRRYDIYRGVYPMQDLADPEERVWLCIHAAPAFYACTTHAASTSTTIALAQCRYLLNSAVPSMRRRGGVDPVVLGADLNLLADHTPGPQSCLPDGYQRVDDGVRQDIVTSPGLAPRSPAIISMRGTTDHPALLAELTLTR
jgi:hypothetical protein